MEFYDSGKKTFRYLLENYKVISDHYESKEKEEKYLPPTLCKGRERKKVVEIPRVEYQIEMTKEIIIKNNRPRANSKFEQLTFSPEIKEKIDEQHLDLTSISPCVLVGHDKQNPRKLVLLGSDQHIENLKELLCENEIQYILLRINKTNDIETPRSVLIRWIGNDVTTTGKMRNWEDYEKIKNFFMNYHVELTALNMENFTLENIKKLSKPDSGKHTID